MKMSEMVSASLLATVAIVSAALAICLNPNEATAEKTIPVSFENYNQAETARNFSNWTKMGADNNLLHLKDLSPIGKGAPTIRMNLDTLYSIGVYDNDGEMLITIPESDLYQTIMILDTDGYAPFFLSEPGTYPIVHQSKTLFVAVRTVVEDRHSEESLNHARAAQAGLKVEGNGSAPYMPPAYDQDQLHKLTAEYNAKILESGVAYTYGDGVTPVNEEHRTWSNAAGWGGMAPELGVTNYYTTSKNLPGDVCHAVTFPETGNKFFTSFTIYDTDGYLMEGNSHISSYTWKSNADGTTTIHFNCDGKPNNVTSNGQTFNYIVRSYGVSQKIIDEEINPINAAPVN